MKLPNRLGAIVTKGRLIFAGAAICAFCAFDGPTGKELWRFPMSS